MHFSLQMTAANMTVSTLQLLLLTAVTQAAVALTDIPLTTDQLHTVLCVWTVGNRHFAPARTLVVSMPRRTPYVPSSALSDPLTQTDDLQTVSVLLGKLHEVTRWPIEMFRPSGGDTADTSVLQHSYILFVWNEEAGSLNETLENQVENLKHSTSWNPRGRFLVVVTDRNNVSAHLLAAHICSILWQVARIINVVVLIPNQFAFRPLHNMSSTKNLTADGLNLYTWFPFRMGQFGEVKEIILLDEWVFENNGRFSVNANLYPAKVPTDFVGLPIKVAVLGKDLGVNITENSTENDYRKARKAKHLAIDIVQLVCEKMNLTTIFLPPSVDLSPDTFVKEFGDLNEGLSDILTGFIPLIPIVVTSSFDATIPYEHICIKMFLPCPKAIPGSEKILTTFSLYVWLTIGLVMLLTTAVFWCASKSNYRSVRNEIHTFHSLCDCLYNAWAILLAVSVPQQPTTSTLRAFFFLYVCFCFAISTVFQAFFVSYLVEPKYEKKLESIDDLLNSDVVYGHQPILNFAIVTSPDPEVARFLENKKLKEDCSDVHKCIERMATKRDICIISFPGYIKYVVMEMGVENFRKIICTFDETVGSLGLTVLFKKGNPLLERFNILMSCYLEAGLPERFWREEEHLASLRGRGRLVEAAGNEFFAFSIYHLMPAFVLLIVGTVFSSVVFIAELIVNCL